MPKTVPYLLIITICSVLPVTSMADDIASSAFEKAVDAGFGEVEQQLIKKYFGDIEKKADNDDQDTGKSKKSKNKKGKKSKGLPPGLAKKGQLPPGLAKREVLPPGLAKRELPADLEKKLPPPPEGYERQIIENAAIVLVHKATGKVTDIIKDIVIGD